MDLVAQYWPVALGVFILLALVVLIIRNALNDHGDNPRDSTDGVGPSGRRSDDSQADGGSDGGGD